MTAPTNRTALVVQSLGTERDAKDRFVDALSQSEIKRRDAIIVDATYEVLPRRDRSFPALRFCPKRDFLEPLVAKLQSKNIFYSLPCQEGGSAIFVKDGITPYTDLDIECTVTLAQLAETMKVAAATDPNNLKETPRGKYVAEVLENFFVGQVYGILREQLAPLKANKSPDEWERFKKGLITSNYIRFITKKDESKNVILFQVQIGEMFQINFPYLEHQAALGRHSVCIIDTLRVSVFKNVYSCINREALIALRYLECDLPSPEEVRGLLFRLSQYHLRGVIFSNEEDVRAKAVRSIRDDYLHRPQFDDSGSMVVSKKPLFGEACRDFQSKHYPDPRHNDVGRMIFLMDLLKTLLKMPEAESAPYYQSMVRAVEVGNPLATLLKDQSIPAARNILGLMEGLLFSEWMQKNKHIEAYDLPFIPDKIRLQIAVEVGPIYWVKIEKYPVEMAIQLLECWTACEQVWAKDSKATDAYYSVLQRCKFTHIAHSDKKTFFTRLMNAFDNPHVQGITSRIPKQDPTQFFLKLKGIVDEKLLRTKVWETRRRPLLKAALSEPEAKGSYDLLKLCEQHEKLTAPEVLQIVKSLPEKIGPKLHSTLVLTLFLLLQQAVDSPSTSMLHALQKLFFAINKAKFLEPKVYTETLNYLLELYEARKENFGDPLYFEAMLEFVKTMEPLQKPQKVEAFCQSCYKVLAKELDRLLKAGQQHYAYKLALQLPENELPVSVDRMVLQAQRLKASLPDDALTGELTSYCERHEKLNADDALQLARALNQDGIISEALNPLLKQTFFSILKKGTAEPSIHFLHAIQELIFAFDDRKLLSKRDLDEAVTCLCALYKANLAHKSEPEYLARLQVFLERTARDKHAELRHELAKIFAPEIMRLLSPPSSEENQRAACKYTIMMLKETPSASRTLAGIGIVENFVQLASKTAEIRQFRIQLLYSLFKDASESAQKEQLKALAIKELALLLNSPITPKNTLKELKILSTIMYSRDVEEKERKAAQPPNWEKQPIEALRSFAALVMQIDSRLTEGVLPLLQQMQLGAAKYNALLLIQAWLDKGDTNKAVECFQTYVAPYLDQDLNHPRVCMVQTLTLLQLIPIFTHGKSTEFSPARCADALQDLLDLSDTLKVDLQASPLDAKQQKLILLGFSTLMRNPEMVTITISLCEKASVCGLLSKESIEQLHKELVDQLLNVDAFSTEGLIKLFLLFNKSKLFAPKDEEINHICIRLFDKMCREAPKAKIIEWTYDDFNRQKIVKHLSPQTQLAFCRLALEGDNVGFLLSVWRTIDFQETPIDQCMPLIEQLAKSVHPPLHKLIYDFYLSTKKQHFSILECYINGLRALEPSSEAFLDATKAMSDVGVAEAEAKEDVAKIGKLLLLSNFILEYGIKLIKLTSNLRERDKLLKHLESFAANYRSLLQQYRHTELLVNIDSLLISDCAEKRDLASINKAVKICQDAVSYLGNDQNNAAKLFEAIAPVFHEYARQEDYAALVTIYKKLSKPIYEDALSQFFTKVTLNFLKKLAQMSGPDDLKKGITQQINFLPVTVHYFPEDTKLLITLLETFSEHCLLEKDELLSAGEKLGLWKEGQYHPSLFKVSSEIVLRFFSGDKNRCYNRLEFATRVVDYRNHDELKVLFNLFAMLSRKVIIDTKKPEQSDAQYLDLMQKMFQRLSSSPENSAVFLRQQLAQCIFFLYVNQLVIKRNKTIQEVVPEIMKWITKFALGNGVSEREAKEGSAVHSASQQFFRMFPGDCTSICDILFRAPDKIRQLIISRIDNIVVKFIDDLLQKLAPTIASNEPLRTELKPLLQLFLKALEELTTPSIHKAMEKKMTDLSLFRYQAAIASRENYLATLGPSYGDLSQNGQFADIGIAFGPILNYDSAIDGEFICELPTVVESDRKSGHAAAAEGAGAAAGAEAAGAVAAAAPAAGAAAAGGATATPAPAAAPPKPPTK